MNAAEQNDLVVVGGGIAGLAAAVFAARAGLRVTLLEGAADLGGLARTSERDGFFLNLGPRALYPPAARILDELGVHYTGGDPALTGYAVAGGRLYPMAGGARRLAGSPPLAGGEGAAAARSLVALLQADPSDLAHRSLADWAAGLGIGGAARQYLYAVVRLASYIDAPDLLSAAAAQAHLTETGGTVRYLDGGWQTLVDGLRLAAGAAGVIIRRRARAVALRRSAAGVSGVTLAGGETLATESVVLAVSPEAARSILEPAGATLPSVTPVRAAVLDLALRRLPNPEGGFIVSLDRPLYLSVHSLAARLAPDGGALVHVARYLHPAERVAPAAARAQLESLLDLVQPGWRQVVVHQRYLPRMTVMQALPAAAAGGLSGRPPVAVAALPGAYLAGDWVGDEHLLAAAALASARRAATLAARRLAARPVGAGV